MVKRDTDQSSKSLKGLLATLIELKVAKRGLDAKLAKLNSASNELEEQILQRFTAEEISSVRVSGGLATRVVETVPNVCDWDVFYAFVKKHNAFELLQRRVTATAWRERVEAGKPVPGIESFNRVHLKLTLEK